MTTKAPDMLLDTAHKWEDLLPSAVFAGIVGDANHPDGYHISYDDNSKSNYSTTRPPDKPPNMPSANAVMASAIDMSMNKTDMVTSYKRIKAVYDNKNDTRRKYFNAVNCWSGTGDAQRLDLYANEISYASPDHKSHVHDEYARMYCQDPKAGRAHLSVWSGQTHDQWLAQEGDGEMPVGLIGLEKGMSSSKNGRDVGDAIKSLQRMLTSTGDYTGDVDGIYGSSTAAALLKCRQDQGSTATAPAGDRVDSWGYVALMTAYIQAQAPKATQGPPGPPGPPGSPGAPGTPGKDGVPQPGQEFTVAVV
jgi:hypothetical protein